MPTYQYACTEPDCGNRFELVQSFTDPAASECPVCTGAVRKVYGSIGVVFKGSGFYRNDSRPATSESDGGDGQEVRLQVGVEERVEVGVQGREHVRLEAGREARLGFEHGRRPPRESAASA